MWGQRLPPKPPPMQLCQSGSKDALKGNVFSASFPGDLVRHLRRCLYLELALVQPPASTVGCSNRNPKCGQGKPTVHTSLNPRLPGNRIHPMDANCSFLCQPLGFTLVQNHLLLGRDGWIPSTSKAPRTHLFCCGPGFCKPHWALQQDQVFIHTVGVTAER